MTRIVWALAAGLWIAASAFAEAPRPNEDAEATFESTPDPAPGALTADATFNTSVNTSPPPEDSGRPDYLFQQTRLGLRNDTTLGNDATAIGENLPPPTADASLES